MFYSADKPKIPYTYCDLSDIGKWVKPKTWGIYHVALIGVPAIKISWKSDK